jgi:hypothetical protein
MSLAIVLGLWLTAVGCERQPPPPKPVGAATNRHVEETPALPPRAGTDAMIQQMKRPMDDARQTEDILKGAADRTRQQLNQPTP